MKLEIAKVPENIKQGVMVVPMKNKPILALAMENPRISQYPEPARNSTTLSFVAWALNMLGVNHKEGGTGHHTAVFEFINTSLQGYTYEELKQAILMYVRGDFNGKNILVAQQLNALVLGKIMYAFDERKKEMLNRYLRLRSEERRKEESEKNKLTPIEKINIMLPGVSRCFNSYLDKNKIIDGHVWIYELLSDQEIITPKADEKRAVYEKAKEIHKNKPITARQSISDYKKVLLEIERNSSQAVVIESKEILLKQYFDKLVVRYSDKALQELLGLITKNANK